MVLSSPDKDDKSHPLNSRNFEGHLKTPTLSRVNNFQESNEPTTYNFVSNDDKSTPFNGIRKRASPTSTTLFTPSPLSNVTRTHSTQQKTKFGPNSTKTDEINPNFLFEESREKTNLTSGKITKEKTSTSLARCLPMMLAFMTLIFVIISIVCYISIEVEVSTLNERTPITLKGQRNLRDPQQIPLKHFSTRKKTIKPRIIQYPISKENQIKFHHKVREINDPMLHVTPGEETKSQDDYVGQFEEGDCEPSAEWQAISYPTCNSVHEINLGDWGAAHKRLGRDDNLSLLGRGWFRHTWKSITGVLGEVYVIKTLRLERDFLQEYYDLHRKDAVAMEQLTYSPYVLNVYGYCGQTAINEFAHFMEGYSDFEDFARRARDMNGKAMIFAKLQIATMIALGLSDIHGIGDHGYATMVHYDINPKNIELTENGIPKINDFNVAEFLGWDDKVQKPCGFKGRFNEPWWRSPEEMIYNKSQPVLNEKVDVYSLGNVLYILLTGHSPRGRSTVERADAVRKELIKGKSPHMKSFYKNSKDPAIVAIRDAISLCLEADPQKRASSRQVAEFLYGAYQGVKQDMANLTKV